MFNAKNQLNSILNCDIPGYKWSRLADNLEAWLLKSAINPVRKAERSTIVAPTEKNFILNAKAINIYFYIFLQPYRVFF